MHIHTDTVIGISHVVNPIAMVMYKIEPDRYLTTSSMNQETSIKARSSFKQRFYNIILSNYKEKRLQILILDYISFIECGSKLNNDYISIMSIYFICF